MDELRTTATPRAQSYSRWLHQLRNAANCAGVSLSMARRMMARGETEHAAELLEHSDQAWQQCRELLQQAERYGHDDARSAGAGTPH